MEKIIGQEELSNQLDKIFNIFLSSEQEIKPHFILTGESGSGKSLTIKALADKYKIGFIQINGASLTKEGTSGNSVSKALTPMLQQGSNPCVVFVDEFDKLFISGNSNCDLAHESTNGVQNEFLKILEGETTQVFGDYGKYVPVSVSNVLFIFAGAFNGEKDITIDKLRSYGIKTEFLGRVGLVYSTEKLTLDNLYEIIDNSSLLDKYVELYEDVDRETVTYELKAYIKRIYETNTLGARLINSLIHKYFITGKLDIETVKEISFQKKLTLNK